MLHRKGGKRLLDYMVSYSGRPQSTQSLCEVIGDSGQFRVTAVVTAGLLCRLVRWLLVMGNAHIMTPVGGKVSNMCQCKSRSPHP
jgi:hypothetical protein